MKDLARELNRMLLSVALAFGVIFGMWEFGEAAQPGQQYADPLLPVLFCSWLFGCPLYYVVLLVRSVIGRSA